MTRKRAIALAILLAIIFVMSLGPTGFLVGLAAAVLPVPLYVVLALWLDRNEPEPRQLLLKAFLFGMLVASLLSIIMNAAAVAYIQITLGLSAVVGENVGVLLASPIFEELFKGLALLLLFRRQRAEFDNVVDGVVYAAMVGLGFAMTENVLYYGNALAQGHLAAVFAVRGVASPFAHPLFTAMTGIGFGQAREAPNRRTAVARVMLGLATAICLHFIWNVAATAHLFLYAYAIIMVPTFCGVLLLLRASLRRERDIVEAQINAVAAGCGLSPGEVEWLCATGGLSGSVGALAGRAALMRAPAIRRARRAAVELGFARWHAERAGAGDSDAVATLRARLLQELEHCRAAGTPR